MPVVAVAESQNVDATGNLTDVYELTYTVEGKPGTFTVDIPKSGDALAAAIAAINDLNETVLALYAIP
jgi:hypothetical protein